LSDDDRCIAQQSLGTLGLRLRRGELHEAERSRGQQHETKFGHDSFEFPEKICKATAMFELQLLAECIGRSINYYPLGRIVAACKCKRFFISFAMRISMDVVHGAFRTSARLRVESDRRLSLLL
jgi:hypothetical protein